jgi:hypothetical protein
MSDQLGQDQLLARVDHDHAGGGSIMVDPDGLSFEAWSIELGAFEFCTCGTDLAQPGTHAPAVMFGRWLAVCLTADGT